MTYLPVCDIVVIAGPTAAGKSAVAEALCGLLNGEIVSCDAMQVYREARIISDRPVGEALLRVPYHMTGIVSVAAEFNAALYRRLATTAIEDILRRERVPVVCGGTGMYLTALLDGIFEGQASGDPALRSALVREATEKGPAALHQRLVALDPAAAARIHPNDPRRIIRALEVLHTEGRPISQLQKERAGLWTEKKIRIFFIDRDRAELYRRAEARIEGMLHDGLVEEVQALRALPLGVSAARMIGLPEIGDYLDGGMDLPAAVVLMKRNTRHYIKRQLTWFRRDRRLERVAVTAEEAPARTAQRIMALLAERGSV